MRKSLSKKNYGYNSSPNREKQFGRNRMLNQTNLQNNKSCFREDDIRDAKQIQITNCLVKYFT